MDTLKNWLPITGWKQALGLAVFVVLVVVAANKFGIQKKLEKVVG